LGGEPDPRHLQEIAVAASFRTWPDSLLCNAGKPALDLWWDIIQVARVYQYVACKQSALLSCSGTNLF